MGAGFKIKQNGFTIIELLVVIVVIGILVSIITISYDSIQRDVRDNERAADIELITSALENYYNQRGKYPASATPREFNAFISSSGLTEASMRDPSRKLQDARSLEPVSDARTPGAGQYIYRSYRSMPAIPSNRCAENETCLAFEIQWRKEKDGSIQTAKSQYGW